MTAANTCPLCSSALSLSQLAALGRETLADADGAPARWCSRGHMHGQRGRPAASALGRARQARRMSAADVAHETGLPVTTVRALEHAEPIPARDCDAILGAIGIDDMSTLDLVPDVGGNDVESVPREMMRGVERVMYLRAGRCVSVIGTTEQLIAALARSGIAVS